MDNCQPMKSPTGISGRLTERQTQEAETNFASWLFDLAAAHREACRSVAVLRDGYVFRAGAADRALYLVREGCVRMLTRLADGQDYEIGYSCSGSVFGESCLAGGPSRLDSAAAVRDSALIRVPAELVLPQLANDEVSRMFLVHLARRFDQSYDVIRQRA